MPLRSKAVVACSIVALFALAACSGNSSSTDTVVTVPAVSITSNGGDEPASTEPAGTESEATSVDSVVDTTVVDIPVVTGPVSDSGFQRVTPGGDCQCADGSEFSFYVREADPTKVMFFFQGGGACFSAETCAFTSATYQSNLDGRGDPGNRGGVFDTSNADNPVADWSVVYVPYCTGDVHIGNATTEYGNDLTVQHKGYVNGNAALDHLVARFPDAEQVLVTGESAGAIPSPLFAGLTADRLPDADITVLADGSGAYPDQPELNALVGGLWGTENAIPDWPVNEGMTVDRWSLPGLFVQAGTHAPDIRFARHDYAYDVVQTLFTSFLGANGGDLLAMIDANDAEVEAAGVELDSWVAPGSGHTVLASNQFYTEAVDGVRLVDWVGDLVDGESIDDVHCAECGG